VLFPAILLFVRPTCNLWALHVYEIYSAAGASCLKALRVCDRNVVASRTAPLSCFVNIIVRIKYRCTVQLDHSHSLWIPFHWYHSLRSTRPLPHECFTVPRDNTSTRVRALPKGNVLPPLWRRWNKSKLARAFAFISVDDSHRCRHHRECSILLISVPCTSRLCFLAATTNDRARRRTYFSSSRFSNSLRPDRKIRARSRYRDLQSRVNVGRAIIAGQVKMKKSRDHKCRLGRALALFARR